MISSLEYKVRDFIKINTKINIEMITKYKLVITLINTIFNSNNLSNFNKTKTFHSNFHLSSSSSKTPFQSLPPPTKEAN